MSDYTFDFIKSLSDQEIRVVRDYFKMTLALSSSEVNSSKYQDLFNLLIEQKDRELSENEIIEILQTKNLSSIKHILISRIEEALTQNRSIESDKTLDEIALITYLLKKKMLFLRICGRSRNSQRAQFILQLFYDIINGAKKHEIYDLSIEALSFYKWNRGVRLGIDEFEKIQKEIDFYSYCSKALMNASDCYFRIIMNNDLMKFMNKRQQMAFLEDSIKSIQKDYDYTKSVQIYYYLQILKISLSEEEADYKKAVKQCNELVEALKGSKIIYSKQRMGFVHDNLSMYYFFLENYKKAVFTSQIAQSFYDENSFAFLISKEGVFKIHFYSKDFTKAKNVLNLISNHELSDTGKFRNSKFILYRACLYFVQGDFKSTLDQIRSNLELEKDKSGWNINLRILNIMTLIELNKLDEASAAIESMRKYKERILGEKKSDLPDRNWLIGDILRDWEKSGFSHTVENNRIFRNIEVLSEKDKEYSWRYFSNELIPFHVWISEKIKK